MKHFDTVIIGAGLTGLSTAHHLDAAAAATGQGGLANWLLIEREDRIGGLTRTEAIDGYHFNHTGHWLHLRDPAMQQLVDKLMGDEMQTVTRKSRIWSHGALTRFPFQANLHGLPPDVVHDCLSGAIEAALAEARGEHQPPRDFREFCMQTFGSGITDRFMVPYNTKLWGVPPEEISADWCGRFLPRPDIAQMTAGALGITDPRIGYNATFVYPREGGIETFARRLAATIDPGRIRLSTAPIAIDLAARRMRLDDGTEVSFGTIVSSIPLPELFRLVAEVPAEVTSHVDKLRCTSLRFLLYGIRRPGVLDDIQWLYMPERRWPFYRIGCFSNAVASLAPAGCGGLYVECANDVDASDDEVKAAVREFLRERGWLERDDEVEVEEVRHIRYGYVIFDDAYFPAREALLPWLQARGVHSLGRYGSWVYSSMEDALLDGQRVAGQLAGADSPDRSPKNPKIPRCP